MPKYEYLGSDGDQWKGYCNPCGPRNPADYGLIVGRVYYGELLVSDSAFASAFVIEGIPFNSVMFDIPDEHYSI